MPPPSSPSPSPSAVVTPGNINLKTTFTNIVILIPIVVASMAVPVLMHNRDTTSAIIRDVVAFATPRCAVIANGMFAGALVFVSMVDIPAVLPHLRRSQRILWWTTGRNFMVPLGIGSIMSSTTAALTYEQNATRAAWILAAGETLFVLLWTCFVMVRGAIIPLLDLRDAKDSAHGEMLERDLEVLVRRFEAAHNVRVFVQLAAFATIVAVALSPDMR
ncbi:hypothetical protein PPROV_000843900 [Pycnococcus provasolii]|uniref:Uncharacterized protein n=1 Tax=Pycnococcus provasolii TaxID=41880 RepID=A0A830HRD0_9CHLO|nr:hypothetical protein PPROV_000843900 [Pycnococcus provasolii]